jgi:hypothetical protein
MFELSKDKDAFLGECLRWKKMADNLSILKLEEKNLRIAICNSIFQDEHKTKTLNIHPYSIKATSIININIDNAALDAMWGDLNDNEKMCFKFKPELINKNYKTLADPKKINECITKKPGMPTLEIKSKDK